jgi:hypothetical protein
MSVPTFYAGPAKVNIAGVPVFAEGNTGEITLAIDQEADAIESASHGYLGASLGGAVGKLSFTPFGYWGAIPTLFPTWMGVTSHTGSTTNTGALAIGTKLETNYGAGAPTNTSGIVVINPTDGWSVLLKRAGLTRPPDLHLGVGKKPFGGAEISFLPALTNILSAPPSFYTATATGATDITGGTNLGSSAATSSFQQEAWTGTLSGYSTFANLQAEDEWTITAEVKWGASKASKQTVFLYLTSVRFMAKCRLFGVSPDLVQSNLVFTGTSAGSTLPQIPGALLGSPGTQSTPQNLVLTGSSSNKQITLVNVDTVGAGFKFGANELGGGEIGFVSQISFTSGAPQPQLIFSA